MRQLPISLPISFRTQVSDRWVRPQVPLTVSVYWASLGLGVNRKDSAFWIKWTATTGNSENLRYLDKKGGKKEHERART